MAVSLPPTRRETHHEIDRKAGNSVRAYGAIQGTRTGPPAPMGLILFPKEINVPARSAVERLVPNVIHWTEEPRGGHFAAMGQPEVLVRDIRVFFGKVRLQGNRP